MKKVILWCFIAFFGVFTPPALSQSCTGVRDFYDHIKSFRANYDREIPPDRPLSVYIGFYLRHVHLNDKEGFMRISMDLLVDWNEQRFRWNVTEWNCSETHMPIEILWIPSVDLLNSAASHNPTGQPSSALVKASGNVTRVFRLDVNLPITVDTWDWPSDKQVKKLVFGSPNMDSSELVLGYLKPPAFVVTTTSNWEISTEFDIVKSSLNTVDGIRHVLSFELELRRIAPAHSVAAAVVLVAAMLELVAAFALPPPTRAPLCACAALTCAIWLTTVLTRLPPSSPSTPLVISLVSTVCVSAGIACVAAAAVARIARLTSLPPSAYNNVLRFAAKICSLTPDESTSPQAERGAWVAYSKFLDFIFTALILLTLAITLLIYMFG